MIGSQRILGADNYATNIGTGANAGHYVSTVQASTGQRSKLHKVVVSNLTATTLYLWVFDLAAGTTASVAPRMVCECPGGAGICTTLDFSTGKAFQLGIFLWLSTTAPANPTTAGTDAGNDAAILDADYRLE